MKFWSMSLRKKRSEAKDQGGEMRNGKHARGGQTGRLTQFLSQNKDGGPGVVSHHHQNAGACNVRKA